MMDDRILVRLESDDFPSESIQLFELTGREAISQPFSFDIGFICLESAGIDAADMEGAFAALVFEINGVEIRRVHGIIAEIEDLLDTELDTRSYRVRLVPRVHRLSLVYMQEIFMDLSVPEIVQKKLERVGLTSADIEMRLIEAYPKLEFITQYKESDFDFISRLCEHEGISYFFEHDDGADKIVLTDHQGGFRAATSGDSAFRSRGDRRDVYRIDVKTRLVPKMHIVHDYNYRAPLIDPTGSAEAPSGLGGGVVEYGTHVKTPDAAERLARIRSEETEAGHRVYTCESDLGWVSAGAHFSLTGHPKLGDVPLLMVSVEHRATQTVALHAIKNEAPYKNTFRAIDAGLTYRPPRATPRPRIYGMVNGLIEHEIEGTESLFARLDDDGRYLVRMMFDASKPGERSAVSCRIRMAQAHAGPNYGQHIPLKPGTEVLIVFIDGDPDRPVIATAVPNAITPSPVARGSAPAHRIKTASGILIELKDA